MRHGFWRRIWLRLALGNVRKCADSLIMLGQNNGEAQEHLDDAKDALYRAAAAITRELETPIRVIRVIRG